MLLIALVQSASLALSLPLFGLFRDIPMLPAAE